MSQKMNPFPGLRPFEMQEKYLFFGREDQTVELLKRLGQARFLAVVGTSGSGKSSLVRAGLLPELHGGTMTDAGSSWEISVMRPGGDPLTNLARALEDSGIYDTDEDNYYRHLRAMLGRSTMGLIEAVAQSKIKKEDNLLIVVDQFEEIFRFRSDNANHAEEAANFINLLLEASEQTEKSIFVIITMRSDFLGDCSQFRGLAEAVNEGEYLIPRLNRNQRRLAIEGPVKVGGKQIEARLVQELLNDIGDDPDQLPILQHALMRTWEYHEKGGGQGNLDLEHYEATGGMQEALSRHADEVYDELSTDEDRKYCEKIFKALTERVSEGRGIRHPMAMGELAEVVGVDDPRKLVPIVEAYRAAGRTFLMPPDSIELGPKVVVDISHESLMRVWGHLVNWVDEEAQSARIYRRLADTSLLFKENKAGLYRDPDLQISLAWRDQNNPTEAWADRYYSGFIGAMAFLEQSHETSIAEEKAREEARRRELEQARRLAKEERKSRALWQKLVWTFGFAVLAITVGLIVIINSRATIRDNLSRVNLKEANRLANENRQDEAIALLAKTIEENPVYTPAGVRLVSLLEHTALPRSIEKIHSSTGFEVGNSRDSVILDAVNGYIAEKGAKGNLNRYRLLDLDGNDIYSHTTTNRIWNGRIAKNGSYFAFGERNAEQGEFVIRLLNLNTKKQATITNVTDARWFDLSADGKSIAAYSPEGSFYVLETEGKTALYRHTQPESTEDQGNYDYAFSPNGKFVAQSVLKPGSAEIHLTEVASGDKKMLKKTSLDQGGYDLTFSSESQYLFLNYWMMKNDEFSFGKEALALDGGRIMDVKAGLSGFFGRTASFFNDGYIVSGTSSGDMAGYYPSEKIILMKGHNDYISDLDLSVDGMTLASGSNDRTVRFWNTSTGEQLSMPLRFEDAILDIGFSGKGDFLYVSVAGGAVYRIRIPFLKLEPTFHVVSGGASKYHYDEASDRVVHVNSKAFSVIDFDSGEAKRFVDKESALITQTGRKYYELGVNWEENEAKYLTMNRGRGFVLKTVNLDSASVVKEFKLPNNIERAKLDEKGEHVAALTSRNEVEIWDANKVEVIGKSFSVNKEFSIAEVIGDEGVIFCYDRYAGGQFYDVFSGMEASPLLRGNRLEAFYYHEKKIYIVASRRSSIIHFWKKGLPEFERRTLEGTFSDIAVNKAETLLAIATDGGKVKFWDLATKEPVGDVLRHNADVRGMVFHPANDRFVFTFTNDAELFGWDRIAQNVFMGPVKVLRGWNLHIDDEGKALTAQSFSGKFFRIPVKIPEDGFDYASWLPELATSIARFKLNDSSVYEMNSEKEGFNIQSTPMQDWVTWLRDDSRDRNAGPGVDVSINEIVDALTPSKNLNDLGQALRLRPNSPEILGSYAYHLLANAEATEGRKAMAVYHIGQARKLGKDIPFVLYRSAQIEMLLDNQKGALQFIDRAIELDSGNAEYSELKKSLLQNN